MKWDWGDFWGGLFKRADQRPAETPPKRERSWPNWSGPTAQITAIVLFIAVGLGIAAWVIFRVVGFTGFWDRASKVGE
jgi:hypothetical protein